MDMDTNTFVKMYADEKGIPIEVLKDQRIMGPRRGVKLPAKDSELLIKNIPYSVLEDTLVPFLSQVGTVYKLRLMMFLGEDCHKGYGYVTYESNYQANLAMLLLNDTEIAPGIKISMEKCRTNKRIFIGNVPNHKTKDELWKELTRIGMKGIVDVIMYRSYVDRALNRGFVFVEFGTGDEAEIAINSFANVVLFGNKAFLDWSEPTYYSEMNKVKTVILTNLAWQHDSQLATKIRQILGADSNLIDIYSVGSSVFLNFATRRDAQEGLSLCKEYFKGTVVEVLWKPSPTTPRKNNKQIPAKSTMGPGTSYSYFNQQANENDMEPMPNEDDLPDVIKMMIKSLNL